MVRAVKSGATPLSAWFTLGALILLSGSASAYAGLLSLLIDPIKAEFHLSDTAISLLQGSGLAIISTGASLWFARFADTGNRRRLIIFASLLAAGFAIWGALAHSYPQLLIARLGFNVAETVILPAAASMLADRFPERQRGLAMGLLFSGGGLGFAVGAFLLGWTIAQAPAWSALTGWTFSNWRWVFLFFALFNIVTAALFALTSEPKRNSVTGAAPAAAQWRDMLRHVAKERAIHLPLLCGLIAFSTGTIGLGAWLPTWASRTFTLNAAELGQIIGAAALAAGIIGAPLAGVLGDFAERRDRAGPLYVLIGLAIVIGVLCLVCTQPVPFGIAKVIVVLLFVLLAMPVSLMMVVLYSATWHHFSSRFITIFMLGNSVIAVPLGTSGIGLVNDRVFHGPGGIGFSMALVGGSACLIAVLTLSSVIGKFRAFSATRAMGADAPEPMAPVPQANPA